MCTQSGEMAFRSSGTAFSLLKWLRMTMRPPGLHAAHLAHGDRIRHDADEIRA
jgi:hypothetical protein